MANHDNDMHDDDNDNDNDDDDIDDDDDMDMDIDDDIDIDDIDIDEYELDCVAMFPLPDVVMLPGSLMPLHIFEPRYRDMTRDLLANAGLIALARLQPGYGLDYNGRPAVHPTVGVGRVIDSHILPDGRYDILVRGLIRATVAEELPPANSYREIRAVRLADILEDQPGTLGATQHKLVSLCDALSMVIDQGGPELRALVRSAGSPNRCADLVAAVLIVDPDERQQLLENRDPLQRLEVAIQHVSRILMEFGPDQGPEFLN